MVFGAKSSTTVAAVEVVNDILIAIDEKKIVAGLFLDLKKAFDTLCHIIMLSKFRFVGVTGISNDLLRSYFSGRYQFVKVGEVSGSLLPVTMGIPQGSVLGPLCFNVFINDISQLPLKGCLRMFADDSALFYPSSSPEDAVVSMNHDLELIADYLYMNKITLNLTKTKYVLFRARNKALGTANDPSFCGSIIERVANFKYLGLILDEFVTFGAHIRELTKKISPFVGLLYRLSCFLPQRLLKLMYHAYIGSNLQYLITIWGGTCKTLLEPLQILQNKALKSVFGKPIRFSTFELYNELAIGFLPIKGLYDLHLACFMFKALNGLQFTNLNFDVAQHRYPTSRAGDLACRRPRTRCGGSCVLYAGPLIYNQVSEITRQACNIFQFKHEVRNFLSAPQRLRTYLRPH
jgi:Reverse transcriptase (RNA-dependent DNA polymerase)